MSTQYSQDGSFRELVLSIVAPELDRRERLREKSEARAPAPEFDGETLAKIRLYELISRKPYLTKAEAALYLDVSEKSIEEWSARADRDNPFPEDRAASVPRYNRMKIDAWVEREARLRRDRKG